MRVVLGGCMLFTQTQAAMKNKNQEPWWLSASGTVSWCCRTSSLAHGSKAWAQAALPLSFALLEALPNSPQQTHKPVTSLTCPDEIFPFSLQKMCAVQHCQHWGQQCPSDFQASGPLLVKHILRNQPTGVSCTFKSSASCH